MESLSQFTLSSVQYQLNRNSQALGRISAERKGFIRCNNGTQVDLDAQKARANDALNGASCHIDALSAFMLSQANLLEVVVNALHGLAVSTSVIRHLRTIAGVLDPTFSSVGTGAILEGKFKFHPRDKETEEAFRNQLLLSADLLDSLPNKTIGKTYTKLEEDGNLDHVVPEYFVDAFRKSQQKNALILTDDALLLNAYEQIGESLIPRHFSSLSLVRAMAENKQITWDSYLRYFAQLSGYRYHLLPVSPDEMYQAVFPPATGGLVTSAPRNISYLNLPLTLSQDYGVNDNIAAKILSAFFTKLILDESVPSEIADEIFALTIVQALVKRDKKLMARTIFQICSQRVLDSNWISKRRKAKLEILDKQLSGFAQGLDPMVIESPVLLRIADLQSHSQNPEI